jgi:hypothetical protein
MTVNAGGKGNGTTSKRRAPKNTKTYGHINWFFKLRLKIH